MKSCGQVPNGKLIVLALTNLRRHPGAVAPFVDIPGRIRFMNPKIFQINSGEVEYVMAIALETILLGAVQEEEFSDGSRLGCYRGKREEGEKVGGTA
jgi:hypothetical protein